MSYGKYPINNSLFLIYHYFWTTCFNSKSSYQVCRLDGWYKWETITSYRPSHKSLLNKQKQRILVPRWELLYLRSTDTGACLKNEGPTPSKAADARWPIASVISRHKSLINQKRLLKWDSWCEDVFEYVLVLFVLDRIYVCFPSV